MPVQEGQLRSFTNALGKFTARWNTGADGSVTFAGYLNDKSETVNQVVDDYNKFAASPAGRLLSILVNQYEQSQIDPLSYNVTMSTNLLVGAAMVATDPVPLGNGYNPSVTTKADNPFGGYITTWARIIPEASFPKFTTSSQSTAPAVNYTIFDGSGNLYKFGVSDANLIRYKQSLLEAGPGAYGSYTGVTTKQQAHIFEKYLRSLQYNSTGQYVLPGMKKPYPVSFSTGLPIKP